MAAEEHGEVSELSIKLPDDAAQGARCEPCIIVDHPTQVRISLAAAKVSGLVLNWPVKLFALLHLAPSPVWWSKESSMGLSPFGSWGLSICCLRFPDPPGKRTGKRRVDID